MPRQALFAGLIFNENGEPVEVAYVGDDPCYAIPDYGFLCHVSARDVDAQIIIRLRDQMLAHREVITAQILQMLGRDDLFTKAAIDSTLQNLDKQIDLMMEHGMPEDARMYLGMMGFRATVNVHGDVIDLNLPAQEAPDED
jgi:hypothetical protein